MTHRPYLDHMGLRPVQLCEGSPRHRANPPPKQGRCRLTTIVFRFRYSGIQGTPSPSAKCLRSPGCLEARTPGICFTEKPIYSFPTANAYLPSNSSRSCHHISNSSERRGPCSVPATHSHPHPGLTIIRRPILQRKKLRLKEAY